MEKFLQVGGAKLQIITYGNKKNQPIVQGIGIGGGAGKNSLVELLKKDFYVYTFSPRNCLKSTGSFTMDTAITDFEKVIALAKKETKKIPYAIGHSTLGHVLAKICGEKKIVKKAVFIAPLISMSEQNSFLNLYMKYCIRKNKKPFPYLASFYNGSFKSGYQIADQRFTEKEILPFLESLYGEFCTKKLKVPSLVLLAGYSCLRLPLNTNRLAGEWKNLGAEVITYPTVNHWFSGKYFAGVGSLFSYFKKGNVIERFFSS